MSITYQQAVDELRRFGKKRTETVQNLAKVGPPDLISGDLVHGLISRETNHRNIVGGGHFTNGEWIPTGTDRGLGQLNEEVHEDFLRSVWGCDSDSYEPKYSPKDGGAFPRGRVPGLTRGIERVILVLLGNVTHAHNRGVPWDDALFVALCGYNRGIDSAINAYKRGVAGEAGELGGRGAAEQGTSGGDYATDVLERRSLFRRARQHLGYS